MFGLFRKPANQITPDKINTVALLAIKGAFDLTCMVAALSPKRDEEKFRFLYAETFAFVTCLIQMRAQVKYKFKNGQELEVFFEALLEEYQAYSKSDWSTNPFMVKYADLTLSKDVFEFALNDYFRNRAILYGCRDYVALGISEEAFNLMAKSLGYVPATVKQIRDDMVLLIYQIMVIAETADDIPENKQAEILLRNTIPLRKSKLNTNFLKPVINGGSCFPRCKMAMNYGHILPVRTVGNIWLDGAAYVLFEVTRWLQI